MQAPELLQFNIRRVKHNKYGQVQQKIHDKFTFDKSISLDRFMHKNREAMDIEKKKQLQESMKDIAQRKLATTYFKRQKVTEMLSNTLEYMKKF